jgi:hypothetical protein
MIHPGRLTLLTTLTLSACGGGGDSTAPPGDPPAVGGTYDVTGESTNDLVSQFTLSGSLVLTQAGDPPGETLGGTLTLSYSRSEWSTVTVTLVEASVDGTGNLKFFAPTPPGSVSVLAHWSGSFDGAAIVNGRFGCEGECYSGVWRAQRR